MGYKPELNFITEFTLSRNGMVLELKKEFDVIRLAITQMGELGPKYKEMLDDIAVMPLRKVLFENQHTPLILELCPDFKMPITKGKTYQGDDKLCMELPPYEFAKMENWISLQDWAKQKIAYYNKTVADIPEAIPENTFQLILNKLKKAEKMNFSSFLIMLKLLMKVIS